MVSLGCSILNLPVLSCLIPLSSPPALHVSPPRVNANPQKCSHSSTSSHVSGCQSKQDSGNFMPSVTQSYYTTESFHLGVEFISLVLKIAVPRGWSFILSN